MKTFQKLSEVANHLNEKFSKIEGFRVYKNYDETILSGGFYWINAPWAIPSKYAFHETFEKVSAYDNLNDLAESAEKRILNQLKKQKEFDESYALEFGKEVRYTYNYSIFLK